MLVASFCVAIYAEILARLYGAPSTPFFVTSAIPLIPGSTLYYCMSALAEGNTELAEKYGSQTFLCALGIAGGMAHRLVHLRPDQENETLGYCDKSNIKEFCKKMKKAVDKCWDG